jgi:amino acid transporter
VLTAWVLVGTNGGTDAGSVAAADPGVFTIDAMASVLGDGSTTVIDWLLLTSLLAVLMALHNMSSRYLMAFGREGVLPRYLAHTHPERQTPQAAGISQAAIVAVVALVYVLAGADPYVDLGSQAAGIGSLSVIMLMALCSFSVPFYFRRRGAVRPWHHVIAPVAAGLALAYFSYVILDNYALVTGSDSDLVNAMPLLILVTAVVGYVIGSRQRRAPILDAVAQGDPAESATPTP